MPSKATRVYVICSCGWRGKRCWLGCEDDRCGEGGACYGSCAYGSCPQCGARLRSTAQKRAAAEWDRQGAEWWEREGKYLYGTPPASFPSPDEASVSGDAQHTAVKERAHDQPRAAAI